MNSQRKHPMKKMIALVFVGSFLMVSCGGGSLVDRATAMGEKTCACKKDTSCMLGLVEESLELMKDMESASKEDQKAAGDAAKAAAKACK
jgi:hypothetical protein